MTKKNHARAKDKSQLTIAIPTNLLEQIGEIADDEDRSRNNMIGRMLSQQVKAYHAAKPIQFPQAAETKKTEPPEPQPLTQQDLINAQQAQNTAKDAKKKTA